MVKKNRNDAIFKKPEGEKNKILKRVLKIPNQNNRKEYEIFYKFSLASVILIFSFFSLPVIFKYFDDNFALNKTTINISKKEFELTLNKKNNKIDESTNLENVYDDIDVFSSDEENTNTSRLSASTIEQLFQDTNYSLKEVKKTKLVNIGNALDHLPKEMKTIENVKKRKNLFIQIVLPLIIEENTKIKLDRKKLFIILNKNNNSKTDIEWLKKKFKQYGVANNDLSTLKVRMDEIPVSLVVAQAAKETGWGTSRFAQKGNALFGQWTWSGDGIKPAAADSDSTHKVASFKVLKASVKAYQRNINTHSSYRKFRKERAIQRDNEGKLNSLELVKYLDKYAETGIEYTKILIKIIKQNSLTEFDDVKILPTSKKLKNLI
ncbi:MAG: glucosaminidase domain-containing protein [Candidatus Pelagibacter sp.]